MRTMSLANRFLLAVLMAAVFFCPAARADLTEALPLISAGRYVEAQEILAPYVEQHPTELGTRYWYARALLGAGQRAAAVDQFRLVLEKKPESLDTRLYLAQAWWEMRQEEEARAELEELLRRDPQHAAAQELLDKITRRVSPVRAVPPEAGGERIAFVGGGLPVDPGNLDLQSYHFKDYTFSAAPTDWLVTSGLWATTNRWTCQPQWSWYGGYANDAPAVIWTKEEFAGDLIVEVYVAFKMGTDVQGRQYKNPNDVNITICGDGGNLDSGYTFMVGGEHNTVTRIMRGTEVLAQTSQAEFLFPSFATSMPPTYQWHRKWWSLRARKVGNLLQIYVDEKLAAEVFDPVPLHHGRVAVWTYDNGIIIPRARIYYQETVRPRSEPAGTEAWIKPQTEVRPRPVVLTSSTHPSLQNDFEHDLGGWKPLEAESGPLLSLVPGGPADKGHCLAVINRSGGGNFSTMIVEKELDARQYARLSFDYRVPPEAQLNFYLAAEGRWWEIVFTGRESPAPRATVLGKIPGVIADGQWHHAEFDLRGALEQATGASGQLTLSYLHVGNFNNQGYLLAGFGGNPAGCTYYLDNFYLGSPQPQRTAQIGATPAASGPFSGYLVSLNQDPSRVPQGKTIAEPPTEIEVPGPGQWYLHVQPLPEDGSPASVVNYALWVDEVGPRVVGSEPADGAQIGSGQIALQLQEPGGSGLDPASLLVEVQGRALKAGQPGVSLDLQAPAVRLDLARAGVEARSGEDIQVRLVALADRASNPLQQPATFTFGYAPQTDTVAPNLPILQTADGDLCDFDFEHDLGSVSAWGSSENVALTRDHTTATSGQSSLRVTSLVAVGNMGVVLVPRPFDAGKYRLVSFDYKIPPGLMVDFATNVDGRLHSIKFANPDSPSPLGQVELVIADNKWHHAEFDLYEMLRRADPRRASYQVNQLVLADFGWLGNPEGQTYHLDNFRLSPVVSARPELEVAWESSDLGGIGELVWKLDEAPVVSLPETGQEPVQPLKITDLLGFQGFLHLRTRDRAGNWSPVATRRLLVDSQAPASQAVSPALGARVAPAAVALKLQDAGLAGIDPQSIVLSVGGADRRVNQQDLHYHSGSGDLVWYCERTQPEPTVFAPNQEVEVVLKSARDFAGNPVADLPRWSWVMDYTKDTTGPRLAEVDSTSHPTFLGETFEAGRPGPVRPRSGCEVSVVTGIATSGEGCLRVRKTASAPIQVLLNSRPFPADKYPVLAFDYRITKQMRVNLVVEMFGRSYMWAFTGPGRGAVASVNLVRADDKWHRAFIDLTPPLRQAHRQGALVVNAIYLLEQGSPQTPVGGEFFLDNLQIAAPGKGPIVCTWQATDPTGLQGYSYLLTQDPRAMPPEEIMQQQEQKQFEAVAAGLWFLRLRAQDGAGNWGPVETYSIMNGKSG